MSNHEATQAWSLRVPSPPRIVVPPLFLTDVDSQRDEWDSPVLTHSPFNDDGRLDFLNRARHGDVSAYHSLLDWQYESRRQAQPVLPYLYLGPSTAMRDTDFLRREGITLLLAVRSRMSARANLLDGRRSAAQLGIEAGSVDVSDNQELIAAFPDAIDLMNRHLSAVQAARLALSTAPRQSASPGPSPGPTEVGKVLVYCESGNERSALMVAAYLMAMFGMSVIKAVQFVQRARFCASFDDSRKNLLSSFGDILAARRTVSGVTAGSTPMTGSTPSAGTKLPLHCKGSKRKLDDAYDEDVELEHSADADLHRDGPAPFLDGAS